MRKLTANEDRSDALATSLEARVAGYDWAAIHQELNGFGCATLPQLLSPGECRALSSLYAEEKHFRSHVVMARAKKKVSSAEIIPISVTVIMKKSASRRFWGCRQART